MKTYLVTAATLGVLAMTLVGWGCDRGDKKVLLRYRHEPGTEQSYRFSLRGTSQEMVNDSLRAAWSVDATEDYYSEVRRILDDGTAECKYSGVWKSTRRRTDDSTMADSVIRHETPAPEILIYAKPNGKTVDIQLLSDTSQAGQDYVRHHYEQSYPLFPDQPVGPGYTWTQSTRVILPDGPTDATATYTIKGYERVDGYDCVVIEYDNLTLIPLLPHVGGTGEVVSGVHRVRSVGQLDFAYREGIDVRYKERWTLDASIRFIPVGEPDTMTLRQLYEYDADIIYLGTKRP